jgi:hypothetical protein
MQSSQQEWQSLLSLDERFFYFDGGRGNAAIGIGALKLTYHTTKVVTSFKINFGLVEALCDAVAVDDCRIQPYRKVDQLMTNCDRILWLSSVFWPWGWTLRPSPFIVPGLYFVDELCTAMKRGCVESGKALSFVRVDTTLKHVSMQLDGNDMETLFAGNCNVTAGRHVPR